ncbi:MAG: AtpZ/AtpI family protein [Chloroflexi bacterium]|nr:AtpZ/AtpI family protein [Chloroflexota bacterium]
MSTISTWEAIGVVTQFGVTCAVAVWLGFLLGSWLDRRLGTGLIFSLVFALGGMISATVSTVKILQYLQHRGTTRSK